jgi:hypothetical protein
MCCGCLRVCLWLVRWEVASLPAPLPHWRADRSDLASGTTLADFVPSAPGQGQLEVYIKLVFHLFMAVS